MDKEINQRRTNKMRKIEVSDVGIHFITAMGCINAHWVDLKGCGLAHSIRFYRIKSMARFWNSIGQGIMFLIRGHH